jgi:hypothetical protein
MNTKFYRKKMSCAFQNFKIYNKKKLKNEVREDVGNNIWIM